MNFKQLIVTIALLGAASGYAAQYKRFSEKDSATINQTLARYGIVHLDPNNIKLMGGDGAKETPVFSLTRAEAIALSGNTYPRIAFRMIGSYALKGFFSCVKYATFAGAGIGLLAGIGVFPGYHAPFASAFLGSLAGAGYGTMLGAGIGLKLGALYGVYRYYNHAGAEVVTLGVPYRADRTWVKIKELDVALLASKEKLEDSNVNYGLEVLN